MDRYTEIIFEYDYCQFFREEVYLLNFELSGHFTYMIHEKLLKSLESGFLLVHSNVQHQSIGRPAKVTYVPSRLVTRDIYIIGMRQPIYIRSSLTNKSGLGRTTLKQMLYRCPD